MDWTGAEPTLTTERLTLRPFRVSDLQAISAIEADPEVTYFRGIPPQTLEQSLASLRRTLARRRE